MNNYDIFKFKENLLNLINNSGLMIGTAYFVVKDVFKELEEGYKICVEEEFKKSQTQNEDIELIQQNEQIGKQQEKNQDQSQD